MSEPPFHTNIYCSKCSPDEIFGTMGHLITLFLLYLVDTSQKLHTFDWFSMEWLFNVLYFIIVNVIHEIVPLLDNWIVYSFWQIIIRKHLQKKKNEMHNTEFG